MSTAIKRAKAQRRRKNYIKKRNVFKNNKKTETYTKKVPIIKLAFDKNGNVLKDRNGRHLYKIVGTKIVAKKQKNFQPKGMFTGIHAGDGILPKSKKFRKSKRQNARLNSARNNRIKTITT